MREGPPGDDGQGPSGYNPPVRLDPQGVAAGQAPAGQVPAIYDPLHAYDVREDEFDLRTMWRTVVKYRLTIAVVTLVVVLTTFFASLMMLPVYRSTATIEITPNPNQVIKLENVDQGGSTGKGYLETEFNIIRSSSVGRAVIEELALWNEPEINGRLQQRGIRTGLSQVKRVLFGGPAEQQATNRAPETEEELERLVRSSLGAYSSRLGVRLVRGSYLFQISFESFDPELAANVANTVVDEYMRLNDDRRFASTGSARDFLTEEIQRAQARLETSERDLYDFARRFQVVDVEDTNNIMSSRLESLNSELSRVRSERIRAESLLLQAEATPPESMPQLLDEPLVVQLKNDYAELQSEYIRLAEIFKDKYPRIQQLKAEMAQVERSLADEIDKQVTALGVDFEQLQRREELLTREVTELKNEIFDLQDRAVQYNILKREWEANKELYAGLLDRMKEVGVASGLEVNNVSVIDRAVVPGGPFKPNLKNNVAKAGMLGLMGGIALAFLLAFLDNTVRTAEQLEQLLHLASLGLVPMIRGRDPTSIAEKRKSKKHRGDRMDVRRLDLMSHLKRDNELAESYRSIRTSLMFSTPKGAPHVLVVTSASSGEGKTTAAVNLATVFAQNGEKVLLVDADLRKPRVHKTFGVALKPGLTEFLLREPLEQIVDTPIRNVSVLPAGTIPPNPVELITSKTFDTFLDMVRDKYTRVIIDTPPVLGLADAVIAGAKADGVLLVVSAGKVSKDALRQCVKRLRAVYAPMVGCILNSVDITSSEYGEYSRYYYSYKQEDEASNVLRMRRASKSERKKAS